MREFGLRQFFAGLLSLTLVFGIGYSLGVNRGSGPVDQAIAEIVAVDPEGASLESLRQAAIEGALRATGDEWSNYFPQSTMEIFNQRLFNEYSGLGIWLRKSALGGVEVGAVQEGSPAEQVGVKTGDRLLAVNESSLEGLSLPAALAVIRGAVGSTVDVRVDRKGKEYLFSVARTTLGVENVTASEIAEGVLYIEVASFNLGTASQVLEHLSEVSHEKGVIIDLRGNPGGQIGEAVKTAELFVSEGVLLSYQKVNSDPVVFRASSSNPDRAPLVVLIDRDTASAAEILAGALQDRNRAVVIGERSQGKGTVQEFITLNDGSKLELTVAKYRTPSGKVIDGVGIEPDLAATDEEIAKRALQVLSGLATLRGRSS
jgi:carboxyl-terminal processing protease